jgi:hypothetical protein
LEGRRSRPGHAISGNVARLIKLAIRDCSGEHRGRLPLLGNESVIGDDVDDCKLQFQSGI